MSRLRSQTGFLVLLSVLCLIGGAPVHAQSNAGQFLHISDLHFNPFYDGSLFPQLSSQPVENWAGILDKSQPPTFNLMGQDSNYFLIESALDEARRRLPAPDFLLVSGDFLAHNWQISYDRLAKLSHVVDPEAFRAFTAKAVQFLAAELKRRYPTTPILPVLGNGDSDCGDYAITPDGPFLKMFAAAGRPARPGYRPGSVPGVVLPGGALHSEVTPRQESPADRRQQRLLFHEIRQHLWNKQRGARPDELRWLETALEHAHAAGETVWLFMHIPPGIDSFATDQSLQKNGPIVTLWHPDSTGRFLQLLERYQRTIQAAFVGHLHMDDFRVIRLNDKPVLFGKVAPAISPVYGNNPGFQVAQYDRQTGAIENYQLDYLTNLSTDGKPTAPSAATWAIEYDFRETYGFSALNAQTISQLAESMKSNPSFQQSYMKFYTVSAEPDITTRTLHVYRCAILSVTPAELEACMRGLRSSTQSPPVPDKRPVGTIAP